MEASTRVPAEVVLGPIEGEEGAISMAVEPAVGSGDLSFQVTVGSFEQPYCQVDETGSPLAMTQTIAPDGEEAAGEWQATMGPLSVGPHAIICYNATARVRVKVFAGDIPVWDGSEVAMNTHAGRQSKLRQEVLDIKKARTKIG